MRDFIPTRSAYLELREERSGMAEGYRFLDEKRLVLAAEALAELARFEQAWGELRVAYGQAARALQAAIARHGLCGLELYPPLPAPQGRLERSSRNVLGVDVLEIRLGRAEATGGPPAVNPSPEAERCRTLFARLIPLSAALAGMAGNLQRLRDEYQRTARRARALEDVLLPEIDEALAAVDSALDEIEKEEAIRVRWARPEP